MVPVELRLTNFLSYRSMEQPLNFTNIHTACLCGPNGHGKSAILDSITWSLWGRARGVDRRGVGTDDLITLGQDHMQVEFIFELEGQLFRVIRAKTRGRSATRLSFQIKDKEGWRVLDQESVAATQALINKTLRMDYETFVSSAFILQGKADNFTTKSPNERKEILAEILGLALYDQLEQLAREKSREFKEKVGLIKRQLQEIEEEIEEEEGYKQEVKKFDLKLANLRERLVCLEKEREQVLKRKAELEASYKELLQLKEEIKIVNQELISVETQLSDLSQELHQVNQLLKSKEEIITSYKRLLKLRAKEEEYQKKSLRYKEIMEKTAQLKTTLVKMKSLREEKLRSLRGRREELKGEWAKRTKLNKALREAIKKLEQLEEKEKLREEIQNKLNCLQTEKAQLENNLSHLNEKLKESGQKLSLISKSEKCPLCQRTLNLRERAELSSNLIKERRETEQEIEKDEVKKVEIVRTSAELQGELKKLEVFVREKQDLVAEIGRLKAENKRILEIRQLLEEVETEIRKVTEELNTGQYAVAERELLLSLQADKERLGFDPEAHKQVREEIRTLRVVETRKFELERSEKNKPKLQRQISELYEVKKQKQVKLNQMSQRLKRLEKVSSDMAAVKNELYQKERALQELKKLEASLLNERAVALAKVKRCLELKTKRINLAKEEKVCREELMLYETLTHAFGKKGIQALIIENAIPEIEEEANKLLQRLTEGRMNLQFITQKSKRTGGTIETLDLIVSDLQGERKYELYSGGEAFRINFAVRIAISKLLAKRAGARLETLVIDEGFGSQDEEGKIRLIESLATIKNDFKKILVITHLDEIKELFPVRIEVTKKEGIGSLAKVV